MPSLRVRGPSMITISRERVALACAAALALALR